MVGPIAAMGIAEELLFRGVLQGVGGLALALVAYTAVQVFERKWTLAVAALLGGAVWGALFAWRAGLAAPIVAHVLWTPMRRWSERGVGAEGARRWRSRGLMILTKKKKIDKQY